MKLTKGTLRRIIKEEKKRMSQIDINFLKNLKKKGYGELFKAALKKAGKPIPQMSDSEKKEFFNKIDKAWKAKNESVKIKMNALDWGKSTAERNSNLDKYDSLKTDREREAFLRKLKGESLNEARTVSKPIKVDDETMVQIVGDNKGFRELTAALNPKTGKPIQKFGYDRGNEIADSKEELVKKLQKKYGKSIKFESVNETFKYHIKVNKPSEIKSKSVISQIEKLAKRGVRSKEIGLQMGFAGDSKLATDTFQKVKNRVYFDLDKRESVNEAKSQDPTLKEMVKFLKSNYRDEEEFSIYLAIYFYSEANYGGMRSNLYSALSQLSNKMRVRTKFSDEKGTEIEMMVDDLVDEFGGERP